MKNNNQINVPQSHGAMDRFKMLIRSEACSVSSQMDKKTYEA